MRIKLYVISTGKIINIQNVQLKYNRPGRVVVAFDCHKKYEEELWDEEVIFVNHKYKELFRGDMCRLTFLYYLFYIIKLMVTNQKFSSKSGIRMLSMARSLNIMSANSSQKRKLKNRLKNHNQKKKSHTS